ncbi:xylulokinase [Nocardioides terrisoli]|uniref:xylulokinase n=1 Tax=Nocardioides terrisoli TaxID=3388267 RepID=UPI00287B6C0B|nr:FGGY family carbohydrate kinase [Nocardioides marmorisolisilvae]
MTLVAGIDSSTQSCKVVVREADDGALVRTGSAPHPDGTEVDPRAWWGALEEAARRAGGFDDVAAVSVGAQQHGMVLLNEDGDVVRDALLWNDTRSAAQAARLVDELGGAHAWADAVGVIPVAAVTATKLRWVADEEPRHADATAAVCLPHDWLTWRLAGAPGIAALTTDRGDASGTGYFSAREERYRTDLLELAFRNRAPLVPRVLAPAETAGHTPAGAVLGPGTGDNAAAALALDAGPGDLVVSLGTSGVVSAVSEVPTADPDGYVAGFADATGRQLPLVCTLNGAPVLARVARLLGVDLDTLSDLALSAPAGADGLVLAPWFAGERSPDLPTARASVHGLGVDNTTPAHLARAAVEGLLCSLVVGADYIRAQGVPVERVLLVGGGARSPAVREIAPTMFGLPVVVPAPGEYVADGAARQAAWTLTGVLPRWQVGGSEIRHGEHRPDVVARYREVTERLAADLVAGSSEA